MDAHSFISEILEFVVVGTSCFVKMGVTVIAHGIFILLVQPYGCLIRVMVLAMFYGKQPMIK